MITHLNEIFFPELNYSIIFADLFQASSNTTSAYLESLMLYMVLYPDIQEKVYQEIESTIAAGKDIVFADKSRYASDKNVYKTFQTI